MVLADMGTRIQKAIASMRNESVIDQNTLNILLKEISNALFSSDVSMELIKKLRTAISKRVNIEAVAPGVDKRKLIQRAVVRELTNLLDSGKKPYKPKRKKTNIIMFVGLQGAGKTTSVTKMAYWYKKQGWRTALVCADTFRAGAFDQLKQNATKAKIPFYGSYDESDPVEVAREGVKRMRDKKIEIIIVDTSGRHKQEEALFEEMEALTKVIEPDDICFVLDSSIGQAAQDQAIAFKESVDVGSVIITKLDGHAKGGGALSAVAACGAPIVFIGTGEHIDDFEQFETSSFVKRILNLGDIPSLIKIMNNAVDEDEQKMLQENLMKGEISLRDLKMQFQTVMKMGSMSTIMSMIPGLGNMGLDKNTDAQSSNRIQKFLCLMDSMTDQELDSDIKIFRDAKRQRRIVRGSGCDMGSLNALLQVGGQFQMAASKMKGMKLGKNGQMPTDIRDINKMMGMFPPHMQKMLGGPQGFKQLMKKFEGMDPSQMQSQMANMAKMAGMGGGGGKKMKVRRR